MKQIERQENFRRAQHNIVDSSAKNDMDWLIEALDPSSSESVADEEDVDRENYNAMMAGVRP